MRATDVAVDEKLIFVQTQFSKPAAETVKVVYPE